MFIWIEADASMYVHVHVKCDTFRLHRLGWRLTCIHMQGSHARVEDRHVCTWRFGGMHTRHCCKCVDKSCRCTHLVNMRTCWAMWNVTDYCRHRKGLGLMIDFTHARVKGNADMYVHEALVDMQRLSMCTQDVHLGYWYRTGDVLSTPRTRDRACIDDRHACTCISWRVEGTSADMYVDVHRCFGLCST